MRMLFGQIALSFMVSPATVSPVTVRDFIIAKLMQLCGSIGAFKKQRNENNDVGATLTADQPSNFTPVGTVAEPRRERTSSFWATPNLRESPIAGRDARSY